VLSEKPNTSSLYFFIFKVLEENILLTELSVFKMSTQFFGKAFSRILNSDIQLD
jgi:hypothetical protein